MQPKKGKTKKKSTDTKKYLRVNGKKGFVLFTELTQRTLYRTPHTNTPPESNFPKYTCDFSLSSTLLIPACLFPNHTLHQLWEECLVQSGPPMVCVCMYVCESGKGIWMVTERKRWFGALPTTQCTSWEINLSWCPQWMSTVAGAQDTNTKVLP